MLCKIAYDVSMVLAIDGREISKWFSLPTTSKEFSNFAQQKRRFRSWAAN